MFQKMETLQSSFDKLSIVTQSKQLIISKNNSKEEEEIIYNDQCLSLENKWPPMEFHPDMVYTSHGW